MFRYAKICADAWSSLRNCQVKNARILIDNMWDIRPISHSPIFDCHTLYLRRCDKNFVYFHMNRHTFPWARTVYLASHPCDIDVVWRFPESTIILSDEYKKYRSRWGEGRESLLVMPFQEMDKIFSEDRIEPLIVEKFPRMDD